MGKGPTPKPRTPRTPIMPDGEQIAGDPDFIEIERKLDVWLDNIDPASFKVTQRGDPVFVDQNSFAVRREGNMLLGYIPEKNRKTVINRNLLNGSVLSLIYTDLNIQVRLTG